jgi:hypothetical protein
VTSIRVRCALRCALFFLAIVSARSLADVTSVIVDPLSPSTVYAGTSESGVLKSTDGGATWTRAGLADTPVIALAIDPGVPSLLYAVTSTGLHKSANGGATWHPIYTNGSTDWYLMSERPISWTVGTVALARRADPAIPAAVYAGVTYAASDFYIDYVWGDAFVSTDAGETWGTVLPNLADPWSALWTAAPALAAAARTQTTPATIYTGPGDNQVCWIRDGTPVACTRLNGSAEAVNVLVVDQRNPHVVYAGTNGSGVYKTTDAGATWSGGGSGAVRAVVIDPLTQSTVYAATSDQGVLKSTDGGGTWTAANADLGADIRALAIDPLTPAILYAATGAGVFKSTDGGASWNPTGLVQRLQSLSVNPTGVFGGNAATGTVTLNAPAPAGGAAVALSSSNHALASVPAGVTVAAGETSVSFAISTVPVTESAVVTISASLNDLTRSVPLSMGPAISAVMMSWKPLPPSGIVVLGVRAPAGGATVGLTSSDPGVVAVPATVTVPAGSASASFPISITAPTTVTMVTISAAYGGETRSMLARIVPAAVFSVSLHPAKVFAGSTLTGTVTLYLPAPAGGAVVNLSSSNTSVAAVPSSVTVAAGATSATFTVTTNTVLPYPQFFLSISASAGGAHASQTLLVELPEARLSSLTLNPASMAGGSAGVGTVFLDKAAPAGGAAVALSSSNPSVVTVPASVMVAAFATSAHFPVTSSVVSAASTATISAAYGGETRSTLVNVVPVVLSSLSLNPASVSSGSTSTGTVTLSASAPAGGATVSLASSAAAVASIPAAVTVAAGALTANFSVMTVACTSGSATVSSTYGGMTKSAGLTVISNADNVAIEQATYFASKRELRVNAHSTAPSATLRVYVTSSGALIGTMRNLGDGDYSGRFAWPVNPANITVRSSNCGTAITGVMKK